MGEHEAADETLLRRIAMRRDVHALEILYRRYHPRVSRFLVRVSQQPELIEEVYNDVMFVVWERASEFAFRSKVSTWILGIAYRRGMKAAASQAARPLPVVIAEEVSTQDPHITGFEDRRWLGRFLARLSPEHRAVIQLAYYAELPHQEIAEIVGCPVNTVKTRIFHARKALKGFIAREFPEHDGRAKHEAIGP